MECLQWGNLSNRFQKSSVSRDFINDGLDCFLKGEKITFEPQKFISDNLQKKFARNLKLNLSTGEESCFVALQVPRACDPFIR